MNSDLPLRRGVHKPLEDAANAMIKESLRGVTRHSDKSDILTPWKETERLRREVFSASGVPDASVRKGMFHRSNNAARPDLNSRDGIVRARRVDSLQAHMDANGGAGEGHDFQ